MGIKKYLAHIGYHHVLILLNLVSIVLYALLLAGCSTSTSSMPNIYLTALSYNESKSSTSTYSRNESSSSAIANSQIFRVFADAVSTQPQPQLTVRTGYFGICMSVRHGDWICGSSGNDLALLLSSEDDPLNLLWISDQITSGTIFPGLLIISMVCSCFFCIISLYHDGWHDEVDPRTGSMLEIKPFPTPRIMAMTTSAAILATLSALIAGLWQHIASAAASSTAQQLTYGQATGSLGNVALAFGWAGFGLNALTTSGQIVFIVSLRLLDKLTD